MQHQCVIRPVVFRQDLSPDAPENTDVMKIHDILQLFAEKHLLLPRKPEELLEKIRNFRIAEVNGVFAGCVAFRDYGNQLFEVRSLAVSETFHGQGIGSRLVEDGLQRLRDRKIPAKAFALTYRAPFFQRLGFKIVEKSLFPEKIWSDCCICAKFHCCDETAVLFEVNP